MKLQNTRLTKVTQCRVLEFGKRKGLFIKDSYGSTVDFIFDNDTKQTKQEIIREFRPFIHGEPLENLLDSELYGDGECPMCGGECEVVDAEEYRHISGDGYNSERMYDIIEPTKKCLICNHKF